MQAVVDGERKKLCYMVDGEDIAEEFLRDLDASEFPWDEKLQGYLMSKKRYDWWKKYFLLNEALNRLYEEGER